MTGWTNATVPCAWSANDDSYDFKWSKDNSDFVFENPDGTRNTYTMCVGKIMPGVESYLLFVPCVHETLFYTSEKRAGEALKNVGKIKTPEKTFGFTSGVWLVISGECSYENHRWVVRKSYQNADVWNTKLYSAAT